MFNPLLARLSKPERLMLPLGKLDECSFVKAGPKGLKESPRFIWRIIVGGVEMVTNFPAPHPDPSVDTCYIASRIPKE